MSDFVLMDGDKAIFSEIFGAAIVTVKPGNLQGSGPATLNGNKICVAGDEKSVEVSGCPYQTPQYSISGTGTIKIKALAANQKAKKTKTGSKLVLLKGGKFTATFKVDSPAKQPPPGPGSPIPDSTPEYSGKGNFDTSNQKLKGS